MLGLTEFSSFSILFRSETLFTEDTDGVEVDSDAKPVEFLVLIGVLAAVEL